MPKALFYLADYSFRGGVKQTLTDELKPFNLKYDTAWPNRHVASIGKIRRTSNQCRPRVLGNQVFYLNFGSALADLLFQEVKP